jgi:SAM-dependent methyltransferase
MNNMEHLYEQFWEEEDGRIINCTTCGFIHVDPIPTKEQLFEFYREQYFIDIKPFDYDAVTEEFIEQKLLQISQSGSYKGILNRVNRLLPSVPNAPLKMLDIGCGNDLLAKYFQSNQWNSSVIEPSKDAANYLRKFGLDVNEQFADDMDLLNLSDISFVNIQFVLEHIADPVALLDKVYQAMVPGGVIRICVPNDFSDGQMAYQEFYNEKLRWVVQPDHINYFSFSSLSNLLEKCGFNESYRTTDFPLEFLLLGGINYYENVEERKKVSPFVRQFQAAFWKTGRWGKMAKLYEALAQLEMGRSIYMFAVKR